MARRFLLGLALAAVAASCSPFTTSSSNDTADASVPATDAAAVGDATTSTDGVPDGCTLLFADDFPGSALDPSWVVASNTSKRPTVESGEVVLTDGEDGAAVGIWHPVPALNGARLHVEVAVKLSTADGDDLSAGVAMAWAPATANVQTPGGPSDDLAVCANGGNGPAGALAVGLQTSAGLIGDQQRLVVLDENIGEPTCATALTSVSLSRSTFPTTATLDVKGTTASGNFVEPFDTTSLPRAVDIGWVGFTAATSDDTSRQTIAHVRVSSCP